MALKYVIDLSSKAALNRQLNGGKGAGCARLLRFGFNVPHGFVVTVEAFRAFMRHGHIDPYVVPEGADSSQLKKMKERIMATPFPDTVQRAIVRAYRRFGGRVAVRSSMPAEDSDRASYAGQLETVLHVEGDDAVLDSIKTCYAALYGERIAHYRARHATPHREHTGACEMAVVIQRMLDAAASGIAFTADPVTGQRCLIVESAPGFGDRIVSGRVDADRYVIDARGTISEERIVHARTLSQQQVCRLAAAANRIADCMACPQDIEWVWDGTQFYFLQSRPITTLLEKRVYSRRLVSDMTPGLIKPLVWSTNTRGMMRNVFGTLFSHLTDVRGIRFESFVRRITSRLYADMTAFGLLLERIGLPANFFEVVTRDDRIHRRRPSFNWRLLRTCVRSMPFIVRHARYGGAIKEYITYHQQRLQPFTKTPWSSHSELELMSAADRLIAMHGQSQWHMWIATMNMMVRNRMLSRLAQKSIADAVPGNLVRGLSTLKALTPNDAIEGLAREAARLPAHVCELLLADDQERIRTELAKTADGRTFLEQVDMFIEKYGYLSANGTDFTIAPWVENAAVVWKAIGRVVKTHAHRVSVENIQIREQERSRVRAKLNLFVRPFFDALLAATLSYIDVRERMSLIMSQDAYQMRRVFLALGSQFVARGVLRRRDDIFYLYFDEVKEVVQSSIPVSDIQQKVARRRKTMVRDAEIEPAETVAGEYEPEHGITCSQELEYLVGFGSSSGIAQGYARVVLDPVQAPVHLSRDDILVVPFTDIGWTPLFMGIGGIVAETGGQLSHTSIIAREYGLPAVVSVKNATRFIKTGQHITLDGSNGRVYFTKKREGDST